MSPEIVPLAATFGTVAVAAITFLFGPTLKVWIETRARRETHADEGWTEAVEALKEQVSGLRTEVAGLRTEVGGLRRQVSERDERIAALETTIAGQSVSLIRANGRVRQLELAWPPGYTIPEPDPAAHP